MIFSKRLRSDGHIKEFVVLHVRDLGWEVREEEDNRVVTQMWLHDWHRVEDKMRRFTFAALELERAGWTEVQLPESTVV